MKKDKVSLLQAYQGLSEAVAEFKKVFLESLPFLPRLVKWLNRLLTKRGKNEKRQG